MPEILKEMTISPDGVLGDELSLYDSGEGYVQVGAGSGQDCFGTVQIKAADVEKARDWMSAWLEKQKPTRLLRNLDDL